MKSRGCASDCKSGEGVVRVCDSICSDDNPLHLTRGCDDDTFGKNCRTCYTDSAAADADASGHESVMCSTLEDSNSEIRTEVAAAAMKGQNDQSRRRLTQA